MKNLYIRQVEKHLHLPRKAKKEVLRDLNEIFASALEHGETEHQVTERLGPPAAFAKQAAESLGSSATSASDRRWIVSNAAALLLAVLAFVFAGLARLEAAPKDAIGQADTMTQIQVKGSWEMDLPLLLILIGTASVAFVVITAVCRSIRKRKNT